MEVETTDLETEDFQQLPETRRDKEGFLPGGFGRSMDMMTLLFQTSRLQNYERIILFCFVLNVPVCGECVKTMLRK